MHQQRTTTCIDAEFEISGNPATGKIRNVSEGGLFVGSSAIPEQGDNLELNFRAPNGEMVNLSGMVWWTTNDDQALGHGRSGFALRLLEESDEFQRLLDRL
jgi:hypothetical protein